MAFIMIWQIKNGLFVKWWEVAVEKKKSLYCFGFGCDFLPFSSLWKLPIPLWIVTGKSQITHYSYRYVKTPYALNEAVQNAPLLHLCKSTQFKHPYCVYVK